MRLTEAAISDMEPSSFHLLTRIIMEAANQIDILSDNKSLKVAIFFVLIALGFSWINSPYWEGDILDIIPTPPPALQPAPESVEIASSEPAPVIELGGEQSATSGVEASGTSPAANTQPPSDPPEVAAAGSAPSTSSEDSQLKQSIDSLASQLGPDKDLLIRPCRREASSGLCLHRQMDRFFEQLRLVALNKAERPVRMSQFGDSMIMGDQFCGELRRLMQRQFGDGGHGFLYPGNPLRRFGFENIRLGLSDDWTVRTIVRNSEQGGSLFGFAGAEFRATGGPTFSMRTVDGEIGDTFERIGILYFAPGGVEKASLMVSVDGTRTREEYAVEPGSSGIHWIEVPRGPHEITLSYFLPGLRYYGIISELSGSGVVIDNVGLVSSKMEFLDKIGTDHWSDQIRYRGTDLMSFMYGGNASGQSKEAFLRHEDSYKSHYNTIFKQLRENNPNVDCLMMNVLTRAQRSGGDVSVYGAVPEIARAQREIAKHNECALFDLFKLIGGKDGAEAWFRNDPQLLGGDLSHPTREGYQEIARAFYNELMYEFSVYLSERQQRIHAGQPAIASIGGGSHE